ncbi:MAG: hypothetical protein ACHQZQ_06275 [SAR324 cluster bacterium]
MNRLTSDKFFVALFLLFLGALAVGVVLFAIGMHESTYIVSDGIGYTTEFLNRPRYDSHLQGFVFALTFLVAGLLLTAVILMPTDGRAGRELPGPPQPRQRQPRPPASAPPAPQAVPAAPAAAPQPAVEPAPAAVAVPPEPAPPAQPPAQPPAPAKPVQPARSVEEEVLAQNPADLPRLEREDTRFEDTGEDDVVYGTGRVTDDSCWDFVQRHPDSAVKFLYRKTLDNKPLSPSDEDIYRGWEQRGMTRAKIRQIVLEIMSWQSLPDDFPHNIWRELRDQVFEMRSR